MVYNNSWLTGDSKNLVGIMLNLITRPHYCWVLVFAFFTFITDEARANTLLVFGDSISAGYGINSSQTWPALLQQKLYQFGDWQVVNASVSGETTQGGKRRLPELLQQLKPAWVLLELGGNDGLRGYPLARITDNLTAMIKQSQSVGAEVMLLGMRVPPNYGPRYTEPFFQQYQILAKIHDTALVPFLLDNIATDPDLMQADGIHPRAEAQSLITDKVWQVLEPLLTSTRQLLP
jgi:acyl-CoA thioesterase-1